MKQGRPSVRVLKDVVASQVKIHARFGGVVPNLAKREHIKNLPILLKKIGAEKEVKNSLDCIAVTVGPGLEPALWTGIQFAQELSHRWKKPLVGANHLEGHLYSFLFSSHAKKIKNFKNIFPAVGVIVSGGHTMLVLAKNLMTYHTLGETLDDAVGESFDKVARLLNLPYPGGPALERLARVGDSFAFAFPSPMIHQKNYNFSYSGLKTAVLYELQKQGASAKTFSLTAQDKKSLAMVEGGHRVKADIAASFQRAAFDVIATKTTRAVLEHKARTVFIGGGVSANKALPRMIKKALIQKKTAVPVIVPPFAYCQDNATMIALAAFMDSFSKKQWPLEANGMLTL